MKKTFRFLALSLMLLGGTLSSWAGPRPAASVGPVDDTRVGATVSGGVVVYKVVGWDNVLDAYQVEITGLDFDGLATNPTTLDIKTSFAEKYGEYKYKYYVTKISDTQGNTPGAPDYKIAFYAMTDLTSLTFAADEAVIGKDKFEFEVGNYAFYGCTALKTLTLPDNVSKIGTYAFQNTAIENFTIPAKCATIGANAFYNTKKLKKVEVSAAGNAVMIELGKQVFANSYVKELDLSNATALVSINDQAFIYDLSVVNNQLTTVTLPKAVAPATSSNFANLGTTGVCFAHCTGLKEIKNLDISVVTDINPGAFENDGSLLQLDFPYCASINLNGVMSPFKGCAKLAKITFVDGWIGTIGDGFNNVYNTASLTPAEQLTELGYLKEIEFEGAVFGTISDYAFGSASAEDACTGLTTLTFKGALMENATIGEQAFMNCAALATVTFNGINASDNTFAGSVLIDEYAFAGTAITELNLGGITVGDDTYAKTFTIGTMAFAASKLAKANLGNILVDGTKASGVDLTASPIFVSDLLTEFTVGTIEVTDAAGKVEFGDKTNPVVTAETLADYPTGVLTKVNVGQITTNGKVQFYKNSFKSEVLEEVKFAGITSEAEIAGTGYVNIGINAFGCPISLPKSLATKAKKVEIGDIVDADPTTLPSQVEVDIKKGAFYGDKLTSVKIGELGAKTITIAEDAFSGNQLTSVEIGNITGATVTINDAFQNENAEEAMDETVTIGDLASPALTIAANAFVGPQEDGSSFTVEIGNFENMSSIATGAFKSPAVGETSYTIGDINATTGIQAGAFAGSTDEDLNSNTTVEIGDYNKVFGVYGVFTNVKDLTAASWNVNSILSRIGVPVTLTVTGDVTDNLSGDQTEGKVTSLTIGGNVTKAGSILKFGKSVRSIEFSGTNPTAEDIADGKEEATIAAGAIAESAFELAADDAFANDEKVVVIYRQKTAKKSENIFNKYAFTNSGAPVEDIAAVLYTDDWSKANTFENVDIVQDFIYRLSLSAGDVAPGEDILATCVVKEGGNYAYGRLFVPAGAGMYYKVSADKVGDKNTVNLFWGQNDGTNSDIYMMQLPIFEGYYWIDATEANQTFIVRTSNIEGAEGGKVTLEAEPATAEDIEMIALDPDYYWFDANDAKKNSLRYATAEVANQELQDFDEFKQKSVFVMLNPKSKGLAFGLLNQYETERSLAKGSIYVVASKMKPAGAPARLNVIWDDEAEDATAIQKVENKSENADAIYNLQGVRVKNAQKGIFIINGKKYVK